MRLRHFGVLLATACLVNAGATAYGFWTFRHVGDSVRWALAVTAPANAARAAAADRSVAGLGSATRLPEVELYSDFGCAACRRSAAAVDSARRVLGDSVTWTYRFLAPAASSDQLSYRAALVGVCASALGRFWSYYAEVNRGSSLQERTLAVAASAAGISEADMDACARDEETQSRVWSDMFRAAALNVTATPTVVVTGVKVAGQLSTDALLDFIRMRAQAARAR